MQSFEKVLSLLQCPLCSGDLAYAPVATEAERGRYGILTCACSRYPLIDDIPVLMKGPLGIVSYWNDRSLHVGPTAQDLVAALERGVTTEALLDCLVFPQKFPLQGRLTRAGLWPLSLSKQVGLAQTRAGLRALLKSVDSCAQDAFRFFHSRRSGKNPYLSDYFLNRFGIPRYLSAMALVQRLVASENPVLDVACGFGHFEHYLTRRRRRTPAIGVDFNFYQIWAAKKWVAPDAHFVCCDASGL